MGNIMSGAALGALNDNAYHKSQSQLSGSTRAAQDIYRTEQIKNTQGRADALLQRCLTSAVLAVTSSAAI